MIHVFFRIPVARVNFPGGLNSSKVKWEESTGATFARRRRYFVPFIILIGRMVIGLSTYKKRKDCIFKSARMRMARVPFWKQQTTWRASSIYVKLLIIHQHQDPKHSLVERSSNREKLMYCLANFSVRNVKDSIVPSGLSLHLLYE